MADTPGRICGIPMLTSVRTLFTVPANKIRIISEIIITNTSSLQRWIKLNHVSPENPTADVSNAFMYETPISARKVVGMGRGWNFAAGDSLQGLSDVGYVVIVTCHYVDRDIT